MRVYHRNWQAVKPALLFLATVLMAALVWRDCDYGYWYVFSATVYAVVTCGVGWGLLEVYCQLRHLGRRT